MAGYLCRHCSRIYPDKKESATCPVHSTATVYDASFVPDDEVDYIRVLRVQVHELDGREWIYSSALHQTGIHDRLAPDEVVQIPRSVPPARDHPGNDLWEIVGYVDDLRAYWVMPLRVPDCVPTDLLSP